VDTFGNHLKSLINNMKGWLDNYGEEANANEGHSSAPKEWRGEGYSNVGRNYSPAWGGQFEEGGSLSDSGPGDNIFANSANKGKSFNEQWMNSPMYKQMLENSMGVNKNPFVFNQNRTDADILNRSRQHQLKNSQWGVGEKHPNNSEGTAAEAYSWYPWNAPMAGRPVNPMSTKSKYPDTIPYVNFVKGKAGQGGDDLDSDAVHEFSHISDASGQLMPKSDLDLMAKYSDNSAKYAELEKKYGKNFADHERAADSEWHNYIKDPTETRARLNDFRMRAKEQGVYDPFTQAFDSKYFKNYKPISKDKDGSYFDPLYQLRDVYTDQEISDMLNKISKSNSNQTQTTAKYGGELPQAQKGKTLPPIYTDDPNDPRLRAYGDTTRANESTQILLNALKEYNKNPTDKNRKAYWKAQDQNYAPVIGVNRNSSIPNQGKVRYINPTSIPWTSQNAPDGDPDYYMVYPKAVQPVIYQEPTLKRKPVAVQPITANTQNFTPQLRTIEQPNVELPAVQRGKYRTSYYDPEMKDWNERAFMSQQESDQFANEMSQRGYPGSYGNVTQRTQYQLGGNVYPVNYVPQAQNGRLEQLGPDAYTAMQPFYETLFEAGNKYANPKTGLTSPFNSLRATMKGLIKHPEVMFMKRHKLPIELIDMDADKNPYHVQGYYTPTPTGRQSWQPTDWAEPRKEHHGLGDWIERMKIQHQENKAERQGRRNRGGTGCWGANCYESETPIAAMGASIPGSVGFTYARTAGSAPSNGPYAKKTKASAENGTEMSYYQNGLDWKPKSISRDGSIIKDDMGYWNPDNWGKTVEIDSPDITMEDVYEPLIGESKQTGEKKLMLPGKNYKFANTKQVIERPIAKSGIRQEQKGLQNLEDLTNFTNYNKPTKGGWLNKYN